MNNIFLSHRGTRSTLEKVFGWLVALAMVLQSSATLPLVAYAEGDAGAQQSASQENSNPAGDNNAQNNAGGTVQENKPVDNSQGNRENHDNNGVGQGHDEEGSENPENDNQGQDDNSGVLTGLFAAMNSNSQSSHDNDNDEHKVKICHIPQGNPENMQTIEVDEHSVTYEAHLSHGDTVGECDTPEDNPEEPKITICHIPEGNIENAQTIEVDDNSVTLQAHMSHGDTVGACVIPPPPPTELSCDDVTGNGWYGQYFNYPRTHDEMNLPSSEWGGTHPDPLGALWTSDWYNSTYYRFDRIDANLMFGENFFPFDASAEELDNGHDYHFGAHWSAYAHVATAGGFTLAITSDDDSWVYVDGVLAIDNSGIHAPVTKTALINLTGKNKIDVYFAERHTVGSHMNLSFTSPAVSVTPVKAGCKEKINLVATKIVCDDESMLPNWGLGGANITNTTATDYVATHEGCHLASDWQFQWGYSGVKNVAGTHVGEADGSTGAGSNTGTGDSDWKTFGPTTPNGVASTLIDELTSSDKIWVREVLKDGYVPFTFDSAHQSNANNVSAEMYCHTDVLNYDNYDYVSAPQGGSTYYCVAFNALKDTPPPPPPVCTVDIVSDSTNTIEGAGSAVATYSAHPAWTASIPGATWIWKTFFVADPSVDDTTTFGKTFTLNAGVSSASLVVAADNSYSVTINGTPVGADTTEYNFTEGGKDTYGVAGVLHSGVNTISFTVKNWAQPGGSAQSNPAGLLYKLHVEVLGNDCTPPPPPPLPATVAGKKINDLNANGEVEQGELGLNGWTITLTEVGGTHTYTTTTGSDGAYTFPSVVDGNYQLCEVNQSGWMQTAPASNNGCYLLNIAPDAHIVDKNFLNTESDKPQCRDGKDNDDDGKIDFVGGDAGCDNPDDNSENQKPVITVTAPNPMIVTLGTPFVDTGATALDPEDGDITLSIVKAESVNTLVVGTYYVSYSVVDSKGLAADPKTREVKVVTACSDGRDNDGDNVMDYPGDTGCDNPEDNDENNRPVITVLGTNPLDITIGDVYTDAGATAADQEDGIITPVVTTGTVNTAVLGSYTVYYNVSDSQGLAAVEKSRLVRVNPVVTQCNDNIDNDGDNRIDFDGAILGGDMAFPPDAGCDSPEDNDENDRPVITVVGTDPMEVSINTTFVDPSATVFDEEDREINNKLVSVGSVNTAILGTYTITYNATDSKNLAAVEKSRTVKVVSSCSDGRDNDNDESIDYPQDSGCSNPEDDAENEKPVITLLGDVVMNIILGSTYTEPSATVADPEEGDITGKLVTTGAVNTAVLGSYTITYNATDSQNLAADTITRTVNVNSAPCTQNCGGGSTPPACSDGGDNDGDALPDFPRDPGCDSPQDNDERDTGPALTLVGGNPMTVTVGTTFTDPGATASDPEEGDITSRIVVTGTVDASTVGNYTLTYNVSDSQGHAATPVTRTVNVVTAGCTTNCGGGGGGGSITLSIYNEKLTGTGTDVTITWDTNQPSDSRVVYGIDAHPTTGTAPLYGYALTSATNPALVTSHSLTLTGIPTAALMHFRPVSSDTVRTAVGIDLHREPSTVPEACFYLREYMRLGIANNPVEVTKLQSFLKNFEGFDSLAVTGTFDITTDAAVRAFQDRYAADVLTPWNLPANTGYVYYTTQKKINEIYCKRTFPLNDTQIAEIESFRTLIATIGAQNVGSATLPLVGVNTEGGVGGDVAGAATVGNEVATSDSVATPERRGRIALADLLATMPNGGDELEATRTDSSDVTVSVEEMPAEGAVAGASTKRGLAAVVASISDRTSISTNAIYALGIMLLAALFLAAILGRQYVLAKKETPEE